VAPPGQRGQSSDCAATENLATLGKGARYARGLLSFGKASELAGVNRFVFSDVLAQRHIARHYGQEELSEDSRYADGQ
jgi:hypothetical protein